MANFDELDAALAARRAKDAAEKHDRDLARRQQAADNEQWMTQQNIWMTRTTGAIQNGVYRVIDHINRSGSGTVLEPTHSPSPLEQRYRLHKSGDVHDIDHLRFILVRGGSVRVTDSGDTHLATVILGEASEDWAKDIATDWATQRLR